MVQGERQAERIKLMQVGLGPIGQKVVKYAIERGELEIAAAIDLAEDKAGKDLGSVCGLDVTIHSFVGIKLGYGVSA